MSSPITANKKLDSNMLQFLSFMDYLRIPIEKLNVGNSSSFSFEWMDSEEAAEYLRISVATLRNLTSEGKIPYSKLGRRNRYEKGKLRDLLLQNKRGQQ